MRFAKSRCPLLVVEHRMAHRHHRRFSELVDKLSTNTLYSISAGVNQREVSGGGCVNVATGATHCGSLRVFRIGAFVASMFIVRA